MTHLAIALACTATCCHGPSGVDLALRRPVSSSGLTELEQQARIQWRWIGELHGDQQACPEAPPEWTGARLFGESQDVPPALARYCAYQSSLPVTDLSGIRGLELIDMAPDTMAIDRMGTALEGHAFDAWKSTFLREAGQASLPVAADGARPVRLAVVDSSPTAEPSANPHLRKGRSWHGYSLVHMARALTCGIDADPDQCVAAISTRLALEYYESHPTDPAQTHGDPLNGGSYGTVSDLARAIKDEVKAWLDSGLHDRLVLNLSLGFDRRFEYDPGLGGMPPDVRALGDALRYASCHGALTVASAGNRIRGRELKEGPILPAAWESQPAPAAHECYELFGVDIQHDPSGQPLLYAAGALRTGNVPLPNSAVRAQPRLLAHGDHAVVEGHLPGQTTHTLTGTSVSALVVSASAAAVWHYRPDLGPAEVMELLANSGTPIGWYADFCLGQPWPGPCLQATRRVQLCQALQDACALGQGLCPIGASFPCNAPSFPLATPVATPGSIDATRGVDCDAVDFDLPGYVCPQRKYNGAAGRPWITKSQPDPEPCVTCYKMKNVIYVEVSSNHTYTMDEAVLTIGETTHPLGPAKLKKGWVYSYDLDNSGIEPTKLHDFNLDWSISMKKGSATSTTCSLFQDIP